MKKGLTTFSLIITFLVLAGFKSDFKVEVKNSQSCLEVIGIALDEKNKSIDGVEVRLFKKNEEMEWMEVTSVAHHDHNFKFVLDQNEYYTIEVSKPGYVSRSVVISTVLPADVAPKPLFSYGFEVKMFKVQTCMDDYYLDFPVALISYNKKHKVFENNENYTGHIKRKIKEDETKALVEGMMNGRSK